MRENLLIVRTVTSTSIEIQIQQLTLDDDMSQFYSYIVQYKESGYIFIDGTRISHRQNIGFVLTTLHGLNPGTDYVVRVLPVRTHEANSISEAGWPTLGVAFTTGM